MREETVEAFGINGAALAAVLNSGLSKEKPIYEAPES
jgi:hypothetical protein